MDTQTYNRMLHDEAIRDLKAEDFDASRRKLEFVVEHGDPEAMSDLAIVLLHQEGAAVDRARFRRLLETASAAGVTQAMVELGMRHLQGLWVPWDPRRGLDWLKKAASRGNVYARYNLSRLLITGDFGVPVDEATGLEWLEVVLEDEAPTPNALAFYADLLLEGRLLPPDRAEAIDIYRMLANSGIPSAMLNLGKTLLASMNPGSLQEGADWIERAARDGALASAMSEYGRMLIYGYCVEQDMDQGVDFLEQALDQGDPEAGMALFRHHLSNPDHQGLDRERLEQYLLRAESLGADTHMDRLTLNQLSDLDESLGENDPSLFTWSDWEWSDTAERPAHAWRDLVRGYHEGVPLESVAHALQVQADAGDANAQNNLGGLYMLGLGVPQDVKKAHVWANRAAHGGLHLADSNRIVLEKRMTPDHIAVAWGHVLSEPVSSYVRFD